MQAGASAAETLTPVVVLVAMHHPAAAQRIPRDIQARERENQPAARLQQQLRALQEGRQGGDGEGSDGAGGLEKASVLRTLAQELYPAAARHVRHLAPPVGTRGAPALRGCGG